MFKTAIALIVCVSMSTHHSISDYNRQTFSGSVPKQVKIAHQYLNKIRANPSKYSDRIGVDLSGVTVRGKLKWNKQLYKAAQRKAEYMAKNSFFGHIDLEGYGMNYWIQKAGYEIPADWVSDKSANFFESIGAGVSTGEELIDMLILDSGVNPPGHRNHLLGIVDFWANCEDIGIGMAYNESSTYRYYWCILIAKHGW